MPDRPAADGDTGLAAIADGTSRITENVFEARFRFRGRDDPPGVRMHAPTGTMQSSGEWRSCRAPVWSSDIRAGAGLVLAGLVADGVTEVHDVYHIDRGYPDSSRTWSDWAGTSVESRTKETDNDRCARHHSRPFGRGRGRSSLMTWENDVLNPSHQAV
ncbi:hypothetical protein GS988_21735 [Rhodococcus hoagii]|nr:hypothetical protein [Prescottella equi]